MITPTLRLYPLRPAALALAALAGLAGCADESLHGIPPDDLPHPQGDLEGRLCDRQSGQWIPFATITLDDEDGTSAQSDADGNFRFDDLPPGEYVLTVEAEGYSGRRTGVVRNGQVTDIGVEVCVPDSGNIRGRVCEAVAEAWLAHAEVSVLLPTGTLSTSTDDDGWFLLENVPVGPHTVYVTGSGIATRTFEVVVRIFDTVTVGDAACGPVGGVIGRICAPDGTWLANATVTLEDAGEIIAETTTDAEGQFMLTDVPAGVGVILTVRRGSFSTFIQVDIPAGEVVVLPEPVCIPPTTNMAVVTGMFDSIEDVLVGLGHQIRTVYTSSGQATQNEDGNVDVIDGLSDYYLEDFLADELWLNEYDIVLFNCGLEDWALVDSPSATTALTNLTNFVGNGKSIYVSDWAAEVVRVAFPGRVNYYGDDNVSGDGRVGVSDYTLDATVTDVGLAAALAADEIVLNLNLGSWVVMEPTENQLSDLQIYVTSASIKIYEGWDEASYPEAPILVAFQHGAGRVLYTSFHNEPLTTQDLADVLRYMVFEL